MRPSEASLFCLNLVYVILEDLDKNDIELKAAIGPVHKLPPGAAIPQLQTLLDQARYCPLFLRDVLLISFENASG
jgi:hypothetical protein